jgi:hypothetical protein
MAEEGESSNGPDGVRRELVRLLLDKVHQDPYPSVTMMDLVEELISDDERADYAAVLMEKIRADQFPSHDLMVRVRNLT